MTTTENLPNDDLTNVMKKTMCAKCLSCENMSKHMKGARGEVLRRMAINGDTIKGVKAALNSGEEYLGEVCQRV